MNTNTDVRYCGGCGQANDCTQNPNYGNPGCCGGACTDLNTDAANCGSCSTPQNPSDCIDQINIPVPPGACCAATCVDTSSDPKNCGKCGDSCGSGESRQNSACCLLTGGPCPYFLACCSGTCTNGACT